MEAHQLRDAIAADIRKAFLLGSLCGAMFGMGVTYLILDAMWDFTF